MENDLLTPEESAVFLKMHVDSVRRLLRQKKLPGVKVGGGWRIPKAALERMLAGDSGGSTETVRALQPGDKIPPGSKVVMLPDHNDPQLHPNKVIDVDIIDVD